MLLKLKSYCTLLWACTGCLLLSVSCAKQQRQLFDTIPADSPVIVQANMDRLLKMAGCSSNAGAITLTPNLQKLVETFDFLDAELLEGIAGCGDFIDLESVMAFDTHYGDLVVTAPLRPDIEDMRLEDVMSERIPTLGRVHVYECQEDISLLTSHNQGWIARCDAERLPQLIDSIVAVADKEPLSVYLKVASYLDRSANLKVYCALPFTENKFGDDFNCLMAALDVNDRTITASAFLGLNGAPVNPISSLTKLNPFVLESMPPRTAAVMAVGLPPSLSGRITEWTSLLPLKQRIAIEALASMIDVEGGTLAVGAAPGGNAETIKKFNLDSWLFKIIAPMGENAESAADMIGTFLDNESYCIADSSYVAVTNYDPEDFPVGDDMWTSAAADAQVFLAMSVPYQSQLMKVLHLKNGYSLEVICNGATTSATLRMMGSSQYILPTLIADAYTLAKRKP